MAEIRTPDAETLEAVYNLNKHAKKYARLAEENYRRHKKATAHANSLKKKALYRAKEQMLKELLRSCEPDAVELHEIDGREYWCIWFGEWSYHVPKERTGHGPWQRLPGLLDDGPEPQELERFESTEEKERSDRPLKACLLHLEAHGINANDFLEETHVSYGSRRFFVGWSYLGDGGKTLTTG